MNKQSFSQSFSYSRPPIVASVSSPSWPIQLQRAFFGLIFPVIAALFLCATASAQVDWANADDGIFSVGSNWVGGDAPLTTEAARFNTGANPQYTVTFSADAETRSAIVTGSSDVLWDLGTNTYSLNETDTSQGLIVGQNGTGALTITNGNIQQTASPLFQIGTGSSGSVGTLLLTGSGTSYSVVDSGTLFPVVGGAIATPGNESLLRIESGASLNAIRLVVGNTASTRGAVEIVGTNSQLTTNHSVNVGQFGHGSLTVQNGGHWQQNGITTTISQATADGSGRLRVDDGTVSVRNLTIGQKGVFDAVLHTNGFGALVAFNHFNASVMNLQSGADGTATLELSLAPGFSSNLGDVFTLFQQNSPTLDFTINGQFLFDGNPISDGSKISVGGYQFEVGITQGPSGSYTLTTIPEPGTVGLMFLAGLFLLIYRRRLTHS